MRERIKISRRGIVAAAFMSEEFDLFHFARECD